MKTQKHFIIGTFFLGPGFSFTALHSGSDIEFITAGYFAIITCTYTICSSVFLSTNNVQV